MANEELRKLIKFGNSSFIISLPKGWIDRNNLKKGDNIYIGENPNNELILNTKKKPSRESSSISINLDKKTFSNIKKEFTSAYIHNYSEIILTGKNLMRKKDVVHRLIQEKIGLEITEEDNSRIVVKDIFDFDTVSIEKVTKRLDNIIKSMMEEMKTGLDKETFKEWTYKEIFKADIEVNKIYFLIMKITRRCQEDASFSNLLKTSKKSLFDLPWFSMQMESLGDELKRMARTFSSINLTANDKKHIIEIFNLFEKDYTTTMSAYFTNDSSLIQASWEKQKYDRLYTNLSEKNQNPSALEIIEKLRRIARCGYNISKLIF